MACVSEYPEPSEIASEPNASGIEVSNVRARARTRRAPIALSTATGSTPATIPQADHATTTPAPAAASVNKTHAPTRTSAPYIQSGRAAPNRRWPSSSTTRRPRELRAKRATGCHAPIMRHNVTKSPVDTDEAPALAGTKHPNAQAQHNPTRTPQQMGTANAIVQPPLLAGLPSATLPR